MIDVIMRGLLREWIKEGIKGGSARGVVAVGQRGKTCNFNMAGPRQADLSPCFYLFPQVWFVMLEFPLFAAEECVNLNFDKLHRKSPAKSLQNQQQND